MQYPLKKVLIISITVFLGSCSGQADNNTAKEDDAVAALAAQMPTSAQVAVAADAVSMDINLLEGAWISTEDPKSKLIITKDRFILAYEGSQSDSSKYTVSKQDCSGRNDGGDGSYYISLPEEEMCYVIDNLDKENLSLVYTARGNTLNYKRVK